MFLKLGKIAFIMRGELKIWLNFYKIMDSIINTVTKPFKAIYSFCQKCLEFFKDDKNQVSSKRVCMAVMLTFTCFIVLNQIYIKSLNLSMEIYQVTMHSLQAIDIALITAVASEKFTNIKETFSNLKEKIGR